MYLNLVREIKAAITNRETLPDEAIVNLASQYRQACDEVNRRLIQVSSLLQMGLRDEAVQVADHPRSLLDSVRELNFKQRQQWVEVLAAKNLEVPPRLEFPAAVRLEQAYEKLASLKPLLKKNRLLALAQAPLRSRIVMLKKLIESDADNPVWKLDIAALQEARLVELREKLRKAKKKNDSDKVREVVTELQTPWEIKVPAELMGEARKLLDSIGIDAHLQNMEAVVGGLQKCLVESDEPAGLKWREQWVQLNQSVNLQPNDPLIQKAAEPLEWLKRCHQQRIIEQKYVQAKVDLQHAVEAQLPLEELNKREGVVRGFGRNDSRELLQQSKAYRETLVDHQVRQSQLLKYTLAGLGAVALAVATWVGVNHYRQGQVAQSRLALAAFVEGEHLEAGQRLYQQLPGYAKSDHEISQLYAKMASLEKQESQRIAMFEEVAGCVDLNGRLGDEVDDLIARASQHAKTDAEKERLSNLKNDLDAIRKQRQQQRTDQYLAEAKPLEDKLAAMLKKVKSATAMPEALAGIVGPLNGLKESASQRIDGLAGVDPAAIQRTQGLIEQANAVVQRAKKKALSGQAVKTLKDQVQRLHRLDSALIRFAKLYPENPNARDFRTSANEREHWNAFEQWRDLAARFQNYDLEEVAVKTLERFNDDYRSAVERVRFTNWTQSVQRMETLLESMVSDPENWLRQLGEAQAFFKQRNYTQIHVLHRDGLRYYLSHPFAPGERKFLYFQRGQSQSEGFYKNDDIGGLAGHCELANDLLNAFESFSGNVDRALLGLLEMSLRKSKELSMVNGPTIDPLVQADFVDQILALMEQSSTVLEAYAKRQRAILQRFQVVDQSWRNVIDDDANAAREKADQAILAINASLDAAQQQVTANLKAMKTWTQFSGFKPAGIIYRDGQRWVADMTSSVPQGRPLYCILPSPGTNASIEKVGVYRDGGVDQGNSVLPLQAGRPVFILEETPK
jgi:hypothetical protein